MNDEYPPRCLARRSFIKTSVVAAVAASSICIFSGLVNAEQPGNSGGTTPPAKCKLERATNCEPWWVFEWVPGQGPTAVIAYWFCYWKCPGKANDGVRRLICDSEEYVTDPVPESWEDDCEFNYGDLPPLIAG